MRIKIDYDGYSECEIIVDPTVFTTEMVNQCLSFFSWGWDEENDPYQEYAKKIAIRVWSLSVQYSISGIKDWFKDAEGWPPLDGSFGIKLEVIEAFEFDEDLINVFTVLEN